MNWKDYVVIDDAFKRPAEVDLLVGDYGKAERELGWKPETDFEQLIRLMVDADLKLRCSTCSGSRRPTARPRLGRLDRPAARARRARAGAQPARAEHPAPVAAAGARAGQRVAVRLPTCRLDLLRDLASAFGESPPVCMPGDEAHAERGDRERDDAVGPHAASAAVFVFGAPFTSRTSVSSMESLASGTRVAPPQGPFEARSSDNRPRRSEGSRGQRVLERAGRSARSRRPRRGRSVRRPVAAPDGDREQRVGVARAVQRAEQRVLSTCRGRRQPLAWPPETASERARRPLLARGPRRRRAAARPARRASASRSTAAGSARCRREGGAASTTAAGRRGRRVAPGETGRGRRARRRARPSTAPARRRAGGAPSRPTSSSNPPVFGRPPSSNVGAGVAVATGRDGCRSCARRRGARPRARGSGPGVATGAEATAAPRRRRCAARPRGRRDRAGAGAPSACAPPRGRASGARLRLARSSAGIGGASPREASFGDGAGVPTASTAAG